MPWYAAAARGSFMDFGPVPNEATCLEQALRQLEADGLTATIAASYHDGSGHLLEGRDGTSNPPVQVLVWDASRMQQGRLEVQFIWQGFIARRLPRCQPAPPMSDAPAWPGEPGASVGRPRRTPRAARALAS